MFPSNRFNYLFLNKRDLYRVFVRLYIYCFTSIKCGILALFFDFSKYKLFNKTSKNRKKIFWTLKKWILFFRRFYIHTLTNNIACITINKSQNRFRDRPISNIISHISKILTHISKVISQISKRLTQTITHHHALPFLLLLLL